MKLATIGKMEAWSVVLRFYVKPILLVAAPPRLRKDYLS